MSEQATEPVAPDLDTELAQWLKERGAQLVFLAQGPAGGIVSADNFPLPPGWVLGVRSVRIEQ